MSMTSIAYENPVYPGYFADPFVWRTGDRYYAVGTGAPEAEGTAGESARIFPLLSSVDLVHWQPIGAALEPPSAELGDTYWAPEVAERDGRFFLYYSVGFGDRAHQLRVAGADRPEGPYTDIGQLTDPRVRPFAIDPHPFRDADGRDYLFYATDFLDEDAGARPGTALVVQELEEMTRLIGEPRTVARAGSDWQRYARDRPMYGATYDWHTLEGPCVVLRDGVYWCMYSGGSWQTAGYGVDYARATHVLGPYSSAGGEAGPRLLRGVPDHVVGPGHHSVVVGPDGVTPFVCYHAWDPAMTARRLCIDPLVFTEDGPRCVGPSFPGSAVTNPGRLPAK